MLVFVSLKCNLNADENTLNEALENPILHKISEYACNVWLQFLKTHSTNLNYKGNTISDIKIYGSISDNAYPILFVH